HKRLLEYLPRKQLLQGTDKLRRRHVAQALVGGAAGGARGPPGPLPYVVAVTVLPDAAQPAAEVAAPVINEALAERLQRPQDHRLRQVVGFVGVDLPLPTPGTNARRIAAVEVRPGRLIVQVAQTVQQGRAGAPGVAGARHGSEKSSPHLLSSFLGGEGEHC